MVKFKVAMKTLLLVVLFIVGPIFVAQTNAVVVAKLCKIQEWHFFYEEVYEFYSTGDDCCAPASGIAVRTTVTPGGSGYSGHYDISESYVTIAEAQADACGGFLSVD